MSQIIYMLFLSYIAVVPLRIDAAVFNIDAEIRSKILAKNPIAGFHLNHSTISAKSYRDSVLISVIHVGTPPQNFQVVFDFDYTDSWLLDKVLRIPDIIGYGNRKWFNSKSNNTAAYSPASVTFGDLDNNHCMSEHWFFIDQLHSYQWTAKLSKIGFSNSHLEDSFVDVNQNFLFNPEYINLGIPKNHYAEIMKHIGAEHGLKHRTAISCNKLHNGTDLVLWFGANNITLSSRDYIQVDELGCFVIFQESYDIDVWQFNTQILQHTCIALDFGKKKIGFSLVKKKF
uniref:Peptidase A1 domain-containing protein n=1 Tax=Ditylenchus dipsaci TaxID=166011 RepID=A0A915D243_9BILA